MWRLIVEDRTFALREISGSGHLNTIPAPFRESTASATGELSLVWTDPPSAQRLDGVAFALVDLDVVEERFEQLTHQRF